MVDECTGIGREQWPGVREKETRRTCSSANYNREVMDGKDAGKGQVPKGEQDAGGLVIELG